MESSNTPPTSLPLHIYVIRHGEKPESATVPPLGVTVDGADSIDSLLPRGWQRAGGLAHLFSPQPGSVRRGVLRRPDKLFSPSYKHGSANHRTFQTIFPLSQQLGMTTQNIEPVGSEPALAAAVLASGVTTALICWEHDHIPLIANAIPTVPGTQIPQTWPGDRFDIVWMFDLVPGSTPPQYTFSQLPQLLLSGDQPTVVPVARPPIQQSGRRGASLE